MKKYIVSNPGTVLVGALIVILISMMASMVAKNATTLVAKNATTLVAKNATTLVAKNATTFLTTTPATTAAAAPTTTIPMPTKQLTTTATRTPVLAMPSATRTPVLVVLTNTPTPTTAPQMADVNSTESTGAYLREEPYGRIIETMPNGTQVQILDDEPVDLMGVIWVHVMVWWDSTHVANGWTAQKLLSYGSLKYGYHYLPTGGSISPDEACADLPRIVQAAVPAPGLQFASPGGEARSVSVYGVISGETESRTDESGIEFDLARLFYLDDGELRALWFATGYVDGNGTYYPMSITDPRGQRAWATRQEAEAIFRQSGKGLRLILNGFLRADKEIAWENCEQWAYANPPGVCSLGLDLELAFHGGSSQFLQSGLAPDDWFAFGWAIEFNGAADTTLPSNAGGCVP